MIMNSIASNSPVFLTSLFFGSEAAGSATLLDRFVKTPIVMIYDGFKPVLVKFFQKNQKITYLSAWQ